MNQHAYAAKKWFRRCVAESFHWSGINRLARKFRSGAVVLYYHGVEPEILDSRVQEIHLPFELFEKHIDYLRKNFDIISLPYLLDCLKNGYRLEPLSALITFDDGYKNNLDVVWPFLSSYEIPFALFISTHHVDGGLRFPTYYLRAALFYTERERVDIKSLNKSYDLRSREKRMLAKNQLEVLLKRAPQPLVRQIIEEISTLIPEDRWREIDEAFHSDEPMTWEDVLKLAAGGVTIGSHCHDHFILHGQQSRSEITYQIQTSKKLIEQKVGNCAYISYPEGGSRFLDPSIIPVVQENQYELGFTSVGGEILDGQNRFILPRLGIPSRLDHFIFNLNTSFRFNRQFERWGRQFSAFCVSG
jgi:hypothetical protein